MSSTKAFEDACEKIKHLTKDPGNDTKLNMYALFKQATEGPCSQPKPSVFDMVKKAKWDTWNSLGSMSQDQAMKKYVYLVDELVAQQTNQGNSSKQNSKYEGLKITITDYITEIKFNRPEKKNAINVQMYRDIISALKEASENKTAVTVLTGEGDYFSSGNDLSNFTNIEGDVSTLAKRSGQLLNEFVEAFIDFPNILVAAVNGPAIGITVTVLGLCDLVYASDKAVFQTPFSSLGQTPEGCSTYTFPKIMGYAKANEILLFGKKITAMEAKELGLVSEVYPHDTFQTDIKNKLAYLSSVSKQSLIYSKELVRKVEREILHNVNDEECERLVERWQSPDCAEAIMKFFQKKSKL